MSLLTDLVTRDYYLEANDTFTETLIPVIGTGTNMVSLVGKKPTAIQNGYAYHVKLADGKVIGQELFVEFVSSAVDQGLNPSGYPRYGNYEFTVTGIRAIEQSGAEQSSLSLNTVTNYSLQGPNDVAHCTMFFRWNGRVWCPLGGTGIQLV